MAALPVAEEARQGQAPMRVLVPMMMPKKMGNAEEGLPLLLQGLPAAAARPLPSRTTTEEEEGEEEPTAAPQGLLLLQQQLPLAAEARRQLSQGRR